MAKGLLLKDDMELELVLLSRDVPTSSLLRLISGKLSEFIKVFLTLYYSFMLL